jgi:hypothetical protein
MVLCSDGMKDEDHIESCDLLSLERELEPRLDGPDENARFTPAQHMQKQHTTKKYLAP